MCYGFDPGFHIEKGEHEEAIFDFIVPKGQKLYIFRFSSFPRTIERRGATHVTMVALFLDDNKTNDDGDGKEKGKKYINKQQLFTCITLFCTFLCRLCTTTT